MYNGACMASPKSKNPGRTALYYRKHPKARAKKKKYDKKYNATPSQRRYRNELKAERRRRGIDGKGGPDVSHTARGTLVLESAKKNRARNGHGNNGRLKR